MRSWLIWVAAGLATGAGAVAGALLHDYVNSVWRWIILYAAPLLFGAALAWRLVSDCRRSVGLAAALAIAVVAAHNLAFEAARRAVVWPGPDRLDLPEPLMWIVQLAVLSVFGLCFALLVALPLALAFRRMRRPGTALIAALAAGAACWSVLPLMEAFPDFIISGEALSLTGALVYAVTAAILGRPLFLTVREGAS